MFFRCERQIECRRNNYDLVFVFVYCVFLNDTNEFIVEDKNNYCEIEHFVTKDNLVNNIFDIFYEIFYTIVVKKKKKSNIK